MEELNIFPQSVLTQNKKIVMMMKNLAVIRKIKRVTPCTRINLRKKKKNLYSKEDIEDEEISEDEEILFMGIETQTLDDELDVEGEVELEDELISDLEEIEKFRRRNKYLKEQLSKYKEYQK